MIKFHFVTIILISFHSYAHRLKVVFKNKKSGIPVYQISRIIFINIIVLLETLKIQLKRLLLLSFQQRHRQIIHVSACGTSHDEPADGFQRMV